MREAGASRPCPVHVTGLQQPVDCARNQASLPIMSPYAHLVLAAGGSRGGSSGSRGGGYRGGGYHNGTTGGGGLSSGTMLALLFGLLLVVGVFAWIRHAGNSRD